MVSKFEPSKQEAIDRFLQSEVSDARSFNPKFEETLEQGEKENKDGRFLSGIIVGIALTILLKL